MGKTRKFQLSSQTLLHIDFVAGLEQNGILTHEQALDQITQGLLEDIPKEAERVVLPFTPILYSMIRQQYQSGRKKIEIWKDEKGERYLMADFHQ